MPLDAPLVHRARELARVAHVDHERKGGGPYFAHLEATARIVSETASPIVRSPRSSPISARCGGSPT